MVLKITVLLIILTSFINAQEFNWVKGMTGEVGSFSIISDNPGNIYVAGTFKGTATFGTIEITSTLTYLTDSFIAKFDASGSSLWVKSLGGKGADEAYGISTDNSGNVYITGGFKDTIYINLNMFASKGDYDIFIAKYDSTGYLLWVKAAWVLDWNYEVSPQSISTDFSGNSYVTGYFFGTATFDTTQLTSFRGLDIFIAKYDPAGNLVWLKQAGGIADDRGNNISVDKSGNVYLTGYFSLTATFENKQIISSGNTDIFIAKYNTDGNLLWLKQAGGSYTEGGLGITVDNFGNVNVTGFFTSTSTFGSGILMGRGGFVTKISEKTGLIENTELEIPSKYTLSQNYPNPFNPSTSIKFEVPISSLVEINLFTVTGEFVKKLVTESKSAGNYEVLLEMNEKTSGVYFYVIKAIPEDGHMYLCKLKSWFILSKLDVTSFRQHLNLKRLN